MGSRGFELHMVAFKGGKMINGLVAGIVLAALFGLVQPLRAQTCLPADDSSVNDVNWLTLVATSSDSEYAARRQRYGIPATQPNKISYVTEETVCMAAAAAYQQAVGTQPPPGGRRVYVVKVGSVYVVRDPQELAGEWERSLVFDKNFNLLSAYLS